MDTSITHIRPRFSIALPQTKEQALERLRIMLEKSHDGIEGRIIGNHIVLDISAKDVHYWSPQLNFRIEEDEDDPSHSIMAGLIGPRPAVWTMFMFIYFSIGIIGFIIGSIGVSRWLLGEFSYLLLAFPIAFLFMLTAYKSGKYGESLAIDQTETLKEFVRAAINI